MGVAEGQVDSTATPRSHALASNLDLAIASQGLPDDTGTTVEQSAPPDNADPETASAVPIPDNPLLTLGVFNGTAHARWPGDDQCVPGDTPVQTSEASTADVSLLNIPGVGGAVALPGTASTRQRTTLVPNGDTRTVVSQVSGSTVDLNLGGGQVKIRLLTEPSLTATATGKSNGSSVTYTAPVLYVEAGGEEVPIPADASDFPIAFPDTPGLSLELSLGDVTKDTAADGTSASGEASVLHLAVRLDPNEADLEDVPGLEELLGELGLDDLLDDILGGLLGQELPVVTLAEADLFPMSAEATAPAGGVDCGDQGGQQFDLTRVAGADRYGTSAEAAGQFSDSGDVILANGEPGKYADALSSDYLAGVEDIPIMLVKQHRIPDSVQDELDAREPETVYVVGGDAAVGEDVVSSLEADGYTVERLSGSDRFATNVDVINAGDKAPVGLGIVATGLDFPDALAAGSLTFQKGLPLGLSRTHDIDNDVVTALQDAEVERVLIMGGKGAVGPEVATELNENGIEVEERFSGDDRSETSTLAADYALTNFTFDDTAVNVASGYPKGTGADALAGGPLSGQADRPVVITRDDTTVDDHVTNYLTDHAATLVEGYIFGGPVAVVVVAEQEMENTVNDAKP